MTNSRVVVIGYVVLGLAVGLFLEHVLIAVFGAFSPTQPLNTERFGSWSVSTVLGLALAAVAAVVLWRKPKTHDASLDIAAELRKVSWPSMAETRAATIAVIVASVVAAVLLGLFDVLWQFLTDKIQNPTL
jgi:preprotein translocase subunit SecE